MWPGFRPIDTRRSRAQAIAYINAQPLAFAPGTKWSYSNAGYKLLGYAIESITGKSSCTATRCLLRSHSTHDGAPSHADANAGWTEAAAAGGLRVYAKGDLARPPILILHELPA